MTTELYGGAPFKRTKPQNNSVDLIFTRDGCANCRVSSHFAVKRNSQQIVRWTLITDKTRALHLIYPAAVSSAGSEAISPCDDACSPESHSDTNLWLTCGLKMSKIHHFLRFVFAFSSHVADKRRCNIQPFLGLIRDVRHVCSFNISDVSRPIG